MRATGRGEENKSEHFLSGASTDIPDEEREQAAAFLTSGPQASVDSNGMITMNIMDSNPLGFSEGVETKNFPVFSLVSSNV